MSFELFDVEFNSKVDMVPDNDKMEIVFNRIGKKFLKEWMKFGKDEGIISDIGSVNQIYRWIKCYEDSCYENMRNSMDLEEVMDRVQNNYVNIKNKEDDK
jgi:hypothetical protein